MLITCLILGLTIVIARGQWGTTLAAELRFISVSRSAFTTVFHRTAFLIEQNIFLNGFARQEQNSLLGLYPCRAQLLNVLHKVNEFAPTRQAKA